MGGVRGWGSILLNHQRTIHRYCWEEYLLHYSICNLHLLDRAFRSYALDALVAITIYAYGATKLEHIHRDSYLQRLLLTINGSYIPLTFLTFASKNDILARITIDIADVLLFGWNNLHEINCPCRYIIEVVCCEVEVMNMVMEE